MELQGLEAVVPSARKESCGRSEYFLRALVCVYSVCCALLVAGAWSLCKFVLPEAVYVVILRWIRLFLYFDLHFNLFDRTSYATGR